MSGWGYMSRGFPEIERSTFADLVKTTRGR